MHQLTMFTKANKDLKDITQFVIDNMKHLQFEKTPSIFDGSIFESLRNGHPHQRGGVGQDLVVMLCDQCGLSVQRISKDGDVNIEGINAEVKTAFQGEDYSFTINQLRPQEYKYVIIVAFTPNEVQIFTVPKDIILNHKRTGGQHGGRSASETLQYSVKSWRMLKFDFGLFAGIDNFESTFGGTNGTS